MRCAREQLAALEHVLAANHLRSLRTSSDCKPSPGVGFVVATTALAVFSDTRRFATAKQAASYAGLVPTTYQLADRHVYGRITRRGSGELRTLLCEAAHHAKRPDHPLNLSRGLLHTAIGLREQEQLGAQEAKPLFPIPLSCTPV